jgi:prophage regulatory protein
MEPNMTDKILKLPDVIEATALSRSSIYAFVGKNTFPKPVPLGARSVGWLKSEIDQWIDNRAQQREATDDVMA